MKSLQRNLRDFKSVSIENVPVSLKQADKKIGVMSSKSEMMTSKA
jgi:hypothetical protein